MRYEEMKNSGVEWIGEIPQHWSIERIKNMATAQESMFIDGDWINSPDISDSGIRYFTTGNVGQGFFKEQGNSYIALETFHRLNCTMAHAGDLIISRLNEPVGRACIIPERFSDCIVAVDNVIFRPNKSYNKRFLMYSMSSDRYAEYTLLLARGTTMQRISRTQLGNICLPVPPLVEQETIAAYLDEKCGAIDKIIAEAKATIEEYMAWKASVIFDAVTKGLDPNAEMKDSGVLGIGMIPVSSKVMKIRYLISYIESGVSVNAGQEPAQKDEFGVLKTSSVSQYCFLPSENKNVNKDEYERVSCPVKSNTIIVSRMNTPELVGACGFVEQDYDNLFLPDRLWQVHFRSDANVKYIWYCLSSGYVRNYYSSLSTGTSSSMQNISQGQFSNVSIVLPSENEQKAIVAYLDKQCAAIDGIIAEKQSLIDDLETYKKSLIYETVTGKRSVC